MDYISPPDLSKLAISTPDLSAPDLSTLTISTPGPSTPDHSTTDPSTPDLSLPTHAPELIYAATSDTAKFALYWLVKLQHTQVEAIILALEKQWREMRQDMGIDDPLDSLVGLATPTPDFTGKTLKDVVSAHIAMDKGWSPYGGLGWLPTVFIVVTKEQWEDGLLLVYVNWDEDETFPMDKCFFKPEDAGALMAILWGEFSPEEVKNEIEAAQSLNP